MKSIWVKINIGDKAIPPLKLYDDEFDVHQTHLQPRDVHVRPYNNGFIPVIISFYSGSNTEIKDKISETNLRLERIRNIVFYLGNLLGKAFQGNVDVSVFFNVNEEGLCIGFLAQGYTPLKYVVPANIVAVNHGEKSKQSTFDLNQPSAKEIFISNIMAFSGIIPETQLNQNPNIVEEWRTIINNLPVNGTSLLVEFEKYKSRLDLWLNLLSSWGLKRDKCSKYSGLLVSSERYVTENGSDIDEDANYEVLSPCWSLWKEDKREDSVVSRGILKKI